MGDICLSVAPILRCQSLSRLEAGVLLLPVGFEVIFAIVLLWVKRGSDKKHVFIASEVIVYFLLAVLDLLTHTIPTIGTSLESFRSLDITIGVGSFIPLFLYTFALYLLTATELVPSLPLRFQSIAKYVLLSFIPIIIVLNELSSFISITYRSFGGVDGVPLELGVGFSNTVAQTFLSSFTLALFAAYQAINFCVAFYRLMRALSHQRTLESTQAEKDMEAHLFRGLGWLVAGMFCGTIETVIGFAQGDGFGIASTRRLLRLIGHGCLIIGIVKGVDTVEDFQLYSPGQAQRRRRSALRAMIANPRLSTFRHVGGHDFGAQGASNPFDEKRGSVIKLGDPSWMRRDYVKPGDQSGNNTRKSRLTFNLSLRPSPSRKSVVRDSTSSFGSSKRNSWPYAPRDEFDDIQADATVLKGPNPYGVPIPRQPRPSVPAGQRVTVHIRQDRLPVLELRRFSNLDFLDLIHDPFRDPQRAWSLPNQFEPTTQHPVGHVSASFTRLPTYNKPASPVPAVPGLPARPAQTKRVSQRPASFASYDRPWGPIVESPEAMSTSARDSAVTFGSRATSAISSFVHEREDRGASFASFVELPPSAFNNASGRSRKAGSSGPPSTITSWVSPGSSAPANDLFAPAAIGTGKSMSRRSRGLSSSTTASEVEAIASQFPVIPPALPFTGTPSHRSMLSQEIARDELVAGPVTPTPVSTAASPAVEQEPEQPKEVARIPSVKRKPAPLITEGLMDSGVMSVEIEQVVDEETAVHSLPTPDSAPHYHNHYLHAHQADVPLTVSDDEYEDDDDSMQTGEVPIVRSASLVRRGEQQGKIMRVKSVGNAPMRSVSSARRTAIPRDSIKVDLGYIARGRPVDEEMGFAQ